MNDEVKSEMTMKYEGHDVKVKAYASGAMSFAADGAEHFIYLYPHQVRLLKVFLSDLQAAE